MARMSDEPGHLHALPARAAADLDAERDDRAVALARAMDVATGRDQWDARDIAIWAEYIRSGTVLDYSEQVQDAARGVILDQIRER